MLYPIFFLITFLYPCFWILRNIVTEKERGIRETLKTMVCAHSYRSDWLYSRFTIQSISQIGLEGFSPGLVMASSLHLWILRHLHRCRFGAEACLWILQHPPPHAILLHLLTVAHFHVLSDHHLLLESEDMWTDWCIDYLHHVYSQCDV